MKTPIIEGLTQQIVDSYLQKRLYDALYWPSFFPLKNVPSLDAKAPEAGRKTVSTQYFDIPKIAQSRVKTEKDILEHVAIKSMFGTDAVIEDYFNDIDFVNDSVNAREEWFALQAL